MEGLRWVERPESRKARAFTKTEVALIEVMDGYETISKQPLEKLVDTTTEAIAGGCVRVSVVREQISEERNASTLAVWDRLEAHFER